MMKNTNGESMGIPDWLPLEAWEAFLAMRKKAKNPLDTDRMIKRQIDRLDGFRKAGHDIAEILDTSTNAKWADTYAPKAGSEWWSSPDGILKKGASIGLAPRVGETIREFQWRIQNPQPASRPLQAITTSKEPEHIGKSIVGASERAKALQIVGGKRK